MPADVPCPPGDEYRHEKSNFGERILLTPITGQSL
jgi:hypothetical protein